MSYQAMKRHEGIFNTYYYRGKEVNLKKLFLHESDKTTFCEQQTYGARRMITGCQGFGRRDEGAEHRGLPWAVV